MNHNQKLTIILTLKNRSEFTYRWLEYMNGVKCPYFILIADGGNDSEIEWHLKDKSSYPNLTYEYIRFPFDENLSFYLNKIVDTVALVESDYLLFADNDDFYLLDNIKTCIDFLDNSDDYVSSAGKSVWMTLYSKSNTIVTTTHGEHYLLKTYGDRGKNIDQADPASRIEYFFQNVDRDQLWLKYYAITRTSAVKIYCEYLKTSMFGDLNMFEICYQMFLLHYGKHREFNFPYYIRQEGSTQSKAELKWENNLAERFVLNNAFSEFRTFLNYLIISDADKYRVLRSFLMWFTLHAQSLYIDSEIKIRKFLKNILFCNPSFAISRINRIIIAYIFNIFSINKTYYINLTPISKYVSRSSRLIKS